MRQKLKRNIKIKTIVAATIFFVIFGTSAALTPVEQLQDDVSEKQKLLDELNAQIENLQKQIVQKQKQNASLKNEVDLFDLNIRQTEVKIQAVEAEIEKLSSEIIEKQVVIRQKTEQIAKQKEYLAENLRLINEYDSANPLEITLGNDTFSEFLDQVQYATNLQEKNQEILTAIKDLKEQLEQQKAELVSKLGEQQNLKNELDTSQKSLEEQRTNKQTLLAQSRGQERIYQSLLSEAAQRQEQVEREIFDIEVSIRRQLGDKTLPPISGLLTWPMSGILTQGYGNTGFRALGYTFHNGLDIAAPAGTKIYAAGNGVVYATGAGTVAYGNWVVIKHTLSKDGQISNIYTLYGHMQRFVVSEGQSVKAGDLVGYEGNTGNTTRLLYGPERGYHLHFTIFDEEGFGIKQGAYQNTYGPYQIPYGYTYNPMDFLK
ncbi:MAG: peptidoglycan DD-metalloendopeptidase family protein [Candidatus Doudnabacteria bacterium]|nr:peptidoglycan DD-metalloendopeptidase family protein [bacterium]MDZ4244054.1 peptidoglycan DD-metalloendopeptidase family protein [Candidatus Doudnabacteria bacterium]